MTYLNNIVTLVASQNNIFYVIVVALILIALLMFYLIYSQNRDIKEALKRKEKANEEKTPNEPFNIYQEESSNLLDEVQVENGVENENNQVFVDEPILDNMSYVSEDTMEDRSLSNYIDNPFRKVENKVHDEVVYSSGVEETSLKEPELIELTDIPIPEKLEYTQALWQNDYLELQSISKELEETQKNHKIDMTPFEAEQEEKAIISYDELVSKSRERKEKEKEVSMLYSNRREVEEFTSFNGLQNKEINENSYEHEEAFLDGLKELKDSLI